MLCSQQTEPWWWCLVLGLRHQFPMALTAHPTGKDRQAGVPGDPRETISIIHTSYIRLKAPDMCYICLSCRCLLPLLDV